MSEQKPEEEALIQGALAKIWKTISEWEELTKRRGVKNADELALVHEYIVVCLGLFLSEDLGIISFDTWAHLATNDMFRDEGHLPAGYQWPLPNAGEE